MLFEKVDGLLVQVSPDREEQILERRHCHGISTTIQVLFSLEEEQAELEKVRADEAAAERAARTEIDARAAVDLATKQEAELARAVEATLSIQERLARLGVNFDELRDEILGVKK